MRGENGHNCILDRAVFQRTITRMVPDIKYILKSFKPFSAQMDFAEVEPKSAEFIYLNRVYTLFLELLSELVNYCRITNCIIPDLDRIDPMSRYSIPTQEGLKEENIPSDESDQETKASKNTYRKNTHFDQI